MLLPDPQSSTQRSRSNSPMRRATSSTSISFLSSDAPPAPTKGTNGTSHYTSYAPSASPSSTPAPLQPSTSGHDSYSYQHKGTSAWKLGKGYLLRATLALQAAGPVASCGAVLLLLALCMLGAAAVTRWRAWGPPDGGGGGAGSRRFSVYMDGGSSGTRVHVFEYTLAPWPAYPQLVLPEPSRSVEPGLSHFASEPQGAAQTIVSLLDFAYSKVPRYLWPSTPVRLLATAGLRLLTEQQRADILEHCSTVLSASQFAFKREWASVIGGDMEGVYAWAGANYASGALEARRALDSEPAAYQGVLELGGASFQVTFMADAAEQQKENTEAEGKLLDLPGVEAKIFTHSFLGLGMDSALLKGVGLQQQAQQQREQHANVALEDPCLPIGYVADDGRVGASSFAGCLAIAQRVLPLSGCLQAQDTNVLAATQGAAAQGGTAGSRPRPLPDGTNAAGSGAILGAGAGGSAAEGAGNGDLAGVGAGTQRRLAAAASRSPQQRCLVDGVATPALTGSFLAVENLYWTSKALGLGMHASLQELYDAGQRHCAMHWTSLQAQFSGHVADQYVTRHCFGAAYIFVLLHLGLGIGLDERRLVFTNTLKRRDGGRDVSLSWVTGAAVVHAMQEEREAEAAASSSSQHQRQQHRTDGSSSGGRVARAIAAIAAVAAIIGCLLLAAVAAAGPRLARGGWQAPSTQSSTSSSTDGALSVSGSAWDGARPPRSAAGTASGWVASGLASAGPVVAAVQAASSGSSWARGSSSPSRPSRLGPGAGGQGTATGALLGPHMIRPTSLGSIDVRD